MTRVKAALTATVLSLLIGGVMLAGPAIASDDAPTPEPTSTATTPAPSPTIQPLGGVGCCKR